MSIHPPSTNTTTEARPLPDLSKKFVHVLERRSDGLVSFEFSIGWPELAVELMLPNAAFDEFCRQNQVIWRDH